MKLMRRFAACTVLGSAVLVSGSGCDALGFFAPARLTDGGGGNLLTAVGKVLGGQLSNMTQDEMQVLNDQIRQAAATIMPELQIPEMTNEQATGVVDFLNANNLNSIEDIQAFAALAEADPSIVIVPQTLSDAYAGSSDPIADGTVTFSQLQQLFEQLLGGLGDAFTGGNNGGNNGGNTGGNTGGNNTGSTQQ